MRPRSGRYERTLRVVMWLDAFLSVALVIVGVVAAPFVATLGVPHRVVLAVGLAAITVAILLAGFGVVTAMVIMARMRGGEYFLPMRLRLPLPAPMRPAQLSEPGAVPADH